MDNLTQSRKKIIRILIFKVVTFSLISLNTKLHAKQNCGWLLDYSTGEYYCVPLDLKYGEKYKKTKKNKRHSNLDSNNKSEVETNTLKNR